MVLGYRSIETRFNGLKRYYSKCGPLYQGEGKLEIKFLQWDIYEEAFFGKP